MEHEAEIVRHLRMQPFTREEIDAVKAGILEASVQGEATRSYASRGEYSGRTLRGWIGYTTAACILSFAGIRYVSTNPSVVEPKTYTTQLGQRANITLADGSQVLLAPATTLKVTGRSVDLNGEAVFNVVQHREDAFTVKAGNTVVRVLGTTFGVRAYDDHVRVAVQAGRISMGNRVLSAGDVANVVNTIENVQHNSDVTSMLAWTTGRLVFRNASVREVLQEIHRSYNVNVLAENEQVASRHINAELDSNQPLSVTLMELAEILGGHFERHEVAFVLKYP